MKALKWIEKYFEGVIMEILLILLTVLVMMQIFMRYLVNSPLSWSEELCRLLLVWSGFFSIGFCARMDTTIRLDTVLNALPAGLRRIVLNLVNVMMVVLLIYLFHGSIRLFKTTAASGSLLPGLQIPQYWLYFGPMVGIFLGILRFIQCFFRTGFYGNLKEGGK